MIINPFQKAALKKYNYRGIVIDDTHNATKYNLKLTALMVLDHADRGIPAGITKQNKENLILFDRIPD